MVGGVVAVVGAVAADVRGEEGVVVSTEQTGGCSGHGRALFVVILFILHLLFKIMVGITRG